MAIWRLHTRLRCLRRHLIGYTGVLVSLPAQVVAAARHWRQAAARVSCGSAPGNRQQTQHTTTHTLWPADSGIHCRVKGRSWQLLTLGNWQVGPVLNRVTLQAPVDLWHEEIKDSGTPSVGCVWLLWRRGNHGWNMVAVAGQHRQQVQHTTILRCADSGRVTRC